jgi:hypothetical protein
MGCCSSTPEDDDNDIESVDNFGAFDGLFGLDKAMCKLGIEQNTGAGFFCHFTPESTDVQIFGILTNNYVLDVPDLSREFTITFETFKAGEKLSPILTVDPRQRFRFCCPVMGATFVVLTDDETKEILSLGRKFLKLHTEWEIKKGDEVLLIQQQAGLKTRFANGSFLRMHGMNLVHTSSADIGSWGSPLALKDGRVIGLHKRKSTKNTSRHDVALSNKCLIRALSLHINGNNPPAKIISNPIRFDSASENRILGHGLSKCAARDNRMLIFVSPEDDEEEEEGNTQTSDEANNTISPIWFVPTSHGWYWTPTDPFDRTSEPNWMSVDTRHVIGGGRQHMKKMRKKDWEIVRWIKSTGNVKSRK